MHNIYDSFKSAENCLPVIMKTVKFKSSINICECISCLQHLFNALCSKDNRDGFMPIENCFIKNEVYLK